MLSRRAFVAGFPAVAAMAAPAGGSLSDITETARRIRDRQVSPVELTRECLERISKLNPSLNAFITVTGEQALVQAREAEAEQAAGRIRSPLHGIPIALKDLYDTAGIRTTAGSQQYADRVPATDAEAVRALKAAGAVMIGKTNMDEFAYNFTGKTSAFGVMRNPWDRGRSAGGSSGGSGVAVASGMCYAALGSDTGGSIRLPASFCGITGLKPTHGRIPAGGVVPLAWSLDHVGPMCRSARDAAILLTAMAPRPEDRLVTADYLKSIRTGVPRAVFYDGLDSEVAGLMEGALKTLAGITNGVRDVKLPELPLDGDSQLPLSYLAIIGAEAYTFHEEMVAKSPERYGAAALSNIKGRGPVTMPQYVRAREHMDRARAAAGRMFGQAEVMVTPTAPAPPFALDSEPGVVFLRNTAPWNFYGLPTISIPCGFTAGGLPVGMQITAAAGRDDLVLGLAIRYQQETDWHNRRPPGV